MPIHMSVHMSMHMSMYMHIRMCKQMSVHMSIRMSLHMSTHRLVARESTCMHTHHRGAGVVLMCACAAHIHSQKISSLFRRRSPSPDYRRNACAMQGCGDNSRGK